MTRLYKTTWNNELQDLHKQIFNEDNKPFFDNLKSKPYYDIFVCEQAGEVVAYCIVSTIAGESEVINIATCPKYRGLGFGEKLLRFAVDCLDADKFFLEVSNNNCAAIALYNKCGFKQISMRKNYYHDGSDAIIMQLDKVR